MARLRLIGFALPSLLLLALLSPGCEKTAQQKQIEEQARQVAIPSVTDQQRDEATKHVEELWARVKDKVVKTYKPDKESLEFYMDLAVLTRHAHRLAGYGSIEEDVPGSLYASKYVADRLISMGFDQVAAQTFPVVQPVTTECKLVVEGKSYRIYPVRPNLLQASVTPAEGITGRTVYVRRGEVADYGNNFAKDKIVVMDFDCDRNWLNAFAFGARAVLFVGADAPANKAQHHVNMPANLPRFYVPKPLAAELELTTRPRNVTLLAACRWRELRGRNVITFIRGTNPKFSPDNPDQAVVLAAGLDSLSEVPELSPGARGAANCAALLAAAEHLKNNPPRRDVIICFFDAQTQNHLGARAFYGALYRRLRSKELGSSLEERLARLDKERQYQTQISEVIDKLAPLAELWKRWGELTAERADLLARKAELEGRKDSPAEAQAEPQATTTANAKQLDARLAELDEKIRALDARLEQPEMAALDLFGNEMRSMPRHDYAVRFLREEAKNFDSDVLDELSPTRIDNARLKRRSLLAEDRIADLKREVEALGSRIDRLEKTSQPHAELAEQLAAKKQDLAETEATLAALAGQIAAQEAKIRVLEERDMGWNSVIRDLFEEKLTKQTRARMARLVSEARKVIDRRTRELDQLTAEANQALALRNTIGPEHNSVVLHVGMNFGDARGKWTFIHGDNSAPRTKDKSGNYSGIYRAMREVYGAAGGGEFDNFDVRAVSERYENRMFCPAIYADSTSIASIFAIFNVSVMTVMDRLGREGQPADTLDALDARTVYSQSRQAMAFLKKLADHRGLNVPQAIRASATITEGGWSANKPSGPSVKQAGAGSAMPNRAVRDAIVAVMRASAGGAWKAGAIESTPPGFVFPIIVKTDTNGIFEVGPYSYTSDTYQRPAVFAATFDQKRVGAGEIAGSCDSRGLISFVTNSKTLATGSGELPKKAVNLFKAKCKTIVGYGYNRGAIKTVVMRAGSTAQFRTDRHLLCERGNIFTLFAPYDAKGMKAFGKTGAVLLNNMPTKKKYQGQGIPLEDPFEHPLVMVRSAHDLEVLNSYRLKTLRESRINHQSLEKLNGEASDLRADAEAQLAAAGAQEEPAEPGLTVSLDKHLGDQAASAALSRRAYVPLVGVMNDLVTAVVLLLLLAMPFAYALERLLIGTPHIYRQIGWFALLFLITFAVLFTVNPAFKIAATPVIIFLAFSIILLSSLVIFILVRKLQTEIKKMQGLGTTVHSADVSRLSTMSAAVNMGISTMRRRPVRTFLTATTVVLLTFTILTFASFGSSWGIRETYEGPMSGAPHRILVRHQLWSPIGQSVYEMLRGHLSGRAEVVPRFWISPTAQQAKDIQQNKRDSMTFIVSSEDVGRICQLEAAIGLDSRDLARQPHLKDLFVETDQDGKEKPLARLDLLAGDGIILTGAITEALGLAESDIGRAKVIMQGRSFTYAGTVSDRLAGFTMLDGSSMLPVDYQASGGSSVEAFAQESTTETLSEMPDVESAQFVSYNVDQIVIVSAQAARAMDGQIRSITIYPSEQDDIRSMSRRAAKLSELPAYVGDRDGVSRMIFTSLAEATGAKDLLIPVLLGGMIIFATMLGSVSDREREIYTFSSLGLAPAHVASLFFAEASIYAVVGGMGGYLLGQIVSHVLGYLAAMGWVTVPSMNYSSTNAIVTILIVMSTVLISTIYPAMKASRSANPGIQRSWRIPQPKGNRYDLIFPFTVSAYDIIGVVSFLKEHFDNYSDTSLGVFTSIRCHIFRQKSNDMLGFRASVALAPFDLGVTQNFVFLSQPSDIEGIDEVRIMIYRLSGAQRDWQRSNRVFINELRKQLLIWRSLTQDIMDRYRQNTLEAWDKLPVEQVDQASIGGQA